MSDGHRVRTQHPDIAVFASAAAAAPVGGGTTTPKRDSSSYDYSDDYHGAHSSAHLDREIKGYDSVIVSNFGFV
ncbi:hypothetical protein H9P43_004363 [Blastocladiella emersonii ATCC 22665]|nr:hypothetical protein H9P43_004363 [Blastocladiella emersonii ATCC 22665]